MAMRLAVDILLVLILGFLSGCASTKSCQCPSASSPVVSFSFANDRELENGGHLFEGVVLGTTEWDSELWERQFVRKLRSHWTAPYQYREGIVSGCITANILVERSGVFRSVECPEWEDDNCLFAASVRVLKSLSGKVPLPKEFPAEALLVTVTMRYPVIES